MASFSTSTSFAAVDRFSATINKFEKRMRNVGKVATRASEKASRGLAKFDKRISRSSKNLLKLAAVAGGLTLGAFISSAAEQSIDFDKNISAAAAKFGEFDRGSDTFMALTNRAREMGATTEFTAGQAAEGLRNLATAGFTAYQAITSLDTVLNLATSTQSDLATASNVAAKTLAAFGLRSKDPQVLAGNLNRVSDVLNKIITTTGFGNLEELLVTVGQSGASAKAAGIQIEEWGAIVGKAVTAGIDASAAGTQLNMALTRMAKPPAEAAKAMRKLGIRVKDSDGNFRNIFAILKDVEKGTKKLGTANRAAALSAIFGARAWKTINVALDNGINNVESFANQLRKAGGTTDNMAKFMRSGLAGMAAGVTSAFQELKLTMEDTFDKEIKRSIEGIKEWTRNAAIWIKDNKELIKTIAGIVGWIIKWTVRIWLLIKAVKIVSTAFYGFQFVLGMLAVVFPALNASLGVTQGTLAGLTVATNIASAAQWVMAAAVNATIWPITLIVLAIIAVIAVIMNWSKITAWISKQWKALADFFKRVNFAAVFRAIGASIFKFLMLPIRGVLKLVSLLPGAVGRAAKAGLNKIDGFADRIRGTSVLVESKTTGVPTTPTPLVLRQNVNDSASANIANRYLQPTAATDTPLPVVTPTITREQINNERMENIQRNMVGITIKDETNRAEVDDKGTDIPIELMATAGVF